MTDKPPAPEPTGAPPRRRATPGTSTAEPLGDALVDALWTRSHGPSWETMDPDATCLPGTFDPDPHDEAAEGAARPTPGGDALRRVVADSTGRRSTGGTPLGVAAPTMIPDFDEDDSVPSGGTAVPLPEEDDEQARTSRQPDGGLEFGPLIGEGGLARVYRARQASLRRDVAVKVVRRAATQRHFLHEARITAALDHPNILPVHDLVAIEDDAPALVMKEVEGLSWRERLDRYGTDDYDLVAEVRVLLAVCQAMAFAHDRGVLHLDLKPGNVMVGPFGEVLVMDWGCATLLPGDPRWEDQPDLPRTTRIRRPFGTPTYMPPELARGEGALVGPASDVYLLGAILVELLSRQRPRRGVSAAAIVLDAAEGNIRRPPEEAPPVLAELARDALRPDPAERPQTVVAFRDRLMHWLDTREARRIIRDARRRLAAAEARIAGLGVVRTTDASPEEELFELIGAFQQARLLWADAPGADEGERQARRVLGFRALEREDAGLATAQALHLPADHPDRDDLLERARAIRERRERQQRQARILRWSLLGTGILLGIVVLVGFTLVEQARTEAWRAARIAEEGLEEVNRLSDHERLAELEREADTLYPAVPDNLERLDAWLAKAEALIARHPVHAVARQRLGEQREGESLDVRWRRRILSELDDGLTRLEEEVVPDVRARRELAVELRDRVAQDHTEAWAAAARRVAEDPRFEGLELAPQQGLVPLGVDPDSGLEAFVSVLSGTVPEPGPDGRLVPREGDGVILLLVPGGEVPMGAAPGDAVHADPRAKDSEGPVHTVGLEPYFIGKYELTQDQWARIMGGAPAAYPVGHAIGGHTVTGLHPMEQIRWSEAREALWRVDLVLPTEAQWERAARGGTTSVYWTGDTVGSLQGAANLADGWAATHEGPESWRYERALDDGHTIHAPVGSLRPNPFGLHDTAGNVWEWCRDRYAPYTAETAPGTGAREAGEDAPRVFRGGGFRATSVHARSADRYSLYADDYRAYDVGVRAAREVE